MMNTNRPKKNYASDGPVFEPFPEPRTVPEGWDLSAVIAECEPAAKAGDVNEYTQENPGV